MTIHCSCCPGSPPMGDGVPGPGCRPGLRRSGPGTMALVSLAGRASHRGGCGSVDRIGYGATGLLGSPPSRGVGDGVPAALRAPALDWYGPSSVSVVLARRRRFWPRLWTHPLCWRLCGLGGPSTLRFLTPLPWSLAPAGGWGSLRRYARRPPSPHRLCHHGGVHGTLRSMTPPVPASGPGRVWVSFPSASPPGRRLGALRTKGR